MRCRFLLLLTGPLFLATAWSQTSTKALTAPSCFISGSLGAGIPTENFASKNVANSGAGFAMPGLSIDASFAFFLNSRVGLQLQGRSVNNPVDVNSLVSQEQPKYPGYRISMSSDPWTMRLFALGVFTPLTVAHSETGAPKVFLDIRAQLGLCVATLPAQTIVMSGSIASASGTASSAKDMEPAFVIGLGLRYLITDRLCWLASADYFSTKAKFTGVVISYSNGTTQNAGDVNQDISVFTLSTGLAVMF